MAIRADLAGIRFGELTVVGYSHTHRTPSGQYKAYWNCVCGCGEPTVVSGESLKSGHTKSCGCVSSELRAEKVKWMHGESGTRLYAIWCGMNSRCHNRNRRAYKHYGKRGIDVCDEWSNFLVFKEWAMVSGYAEDLTIERIDVNKGYSPDNCRWITKREQADNRRTSLLYTYNGETKSLKRWSEDAGIKYTTLRARLFEFGWDFDTAITTPVGRGGNHVR